MNHVHLVVPRGIDDPRRPSGGNMYDRRACRGLAGFGWSVHEHPVSGHAAVAAALANVPDGGLALIDGLVASAMPVAQADRLRIVILLHMPRDEPREAEALSAAAAIVATSEWTRRWLIDNFSVPAERVHVVPPGVDSAELAARTPSGERLLCVGAVTPVKGQDLLIDALGMVADLSWRCIIVGALDLDGEFAEDLLRRGQPLGERVNFTGPLTGAALDRAYADADVLVLASRAETYGMVITEALACGLPAIATDVGGVPEALGRATDGSLPGLLVPQGDARALAQALRRWLANPAERRRLRVAALSRRQGLADWQQAARALSVVLAKVSGG